MNIIEEIQGIAKERADEMRNSDNQEIRQNQEPEQEHRNSIGRIGNEIVERFRWKLKFIALVLLLGVICVGALRLFTDKKNSEKGAIAQKFEDEIIGEEGKVNTVTVSELEAVLKTGKLYTAEYPYNGYAAVCDEDGMTKYYVAYEGFVKAGIDVSEIRVFLSEETSTITIRLPEVKLEEPKVDAGTLEYIFIKNKYNTETVASEAYQKALEDLEKKVMNDTSIIASAAENAKAVEKAFVEPWVNQVSDGIKYTVNVIMYGEEE